MSAAKAEQQSTETLSFRCWCEGCRLTRGRIGEQNVDNGKQEDKMKREFKNPENPVIERFSGGG